MNEIEKFRNERERLNTLIMKHSGTNTKRFFAIDSAVYRDGSLDSRTKEMMGLAASAVMRCDHCIEYHIMQCIELGVSGEEFTEIFDIALIAGGSITIPHIRKAYDILEKSGVLNNQ
ncbi:MAG: carboxymuconolactone decarboxylase family protein [bacterium]